MFKNTFFQGNIFFSYQIRNSVFADDDGHTIYINEVTLNEGVGSVRDEECDEKT